MLEIIKSGEALVGHVVELREIAFTLGMRFVQVIAFDAAKDFVHRLSGVDPPVAKGLGDDRGGEETAHGLLRAAIGIINQVRQSVEHRHRHAGGDLHREARRAILARPRQVDSYRDVVASHLAGLGDELLDAMLVDGVALDHAVRVFIVADRKGDLRFARGFDHGDPVQTHFAVGGDHDGTEFSLDHAAILHHARDGESQDVEGGLHGHGVVGVVVEHPGNRDLVAHHEEPRGLQAGDQRLAGADRDGRDAELTGRSGDAGGGLPTGQRVGVLGGNSGLAVLIGVDVGQPEKGGAEVGADFDLLSGLHVLFFFDSHTEPLIIADFHGRLGHTASGGH